MPCARLGRMYSRFSFTALGLPGRFTIRVLPRSTLTPRLSIPRGVMVRLWYRMASAMPGALRSATLKVTSGVISRGAKPVPPVVRIRFT